MASAFKTTPFGGAGDGAISEEVDQVVALTEDVRNGPTSLSSMDLVNSADAVASLKIYDHTGQGYVSETTEPVLIIPIEADGASDPKLLNVEISPPLKLVNGLSVSASKEDGNVHTNPPDTDLGWKACTTT